MTVTCPNGPVDEEARRNCMAFGVWGEVDAGSCAEAPVTTQVLADLTMVRNKVILSKLNKSRCHGTRNCLSPLQMEVTEESSVEISEALSSSFPPNQPLTLRDVDTFTEFATMLVDVGGDNVEVKLQEEIHIAMDQPSLCQPYTCL